MRSVVAILALFFVSAAPAPDDTKELLLGTWEVTYSDSKDVPTGTRLEFTKDNKVRLSDRADGKEAPTVGGYKLDRDALALTGADGTRNDKARVCLLNKTTLVLHDETEDKVTVLKRTKVK